MFGANYFGQPYFAQAYPIYIITPPVAGEGSKRTLLGMGR